MQLFESNRIENIDCLIGMSSIPDKSIDLILCDLPYGTIYCEWDNIIDFKSLWNQYNRIIKDNGAVLLFASEPFNCKLIQSNMKNFRYIWIWKKNIAANYLNARKMPLKLHEEIVVFYKKLPCYNPQWWYSTPYRRDERVKIKPSLSTVNPNSKAEVYSPYVESVDGRRYPNSILEFKLDKEKLHPTQKPVALLEYLIKTYTNEDDLVLDNCFGSGSTLVAAINTNRRYIGFETDKEYFDIASKRITEAKQCLKTEPTKT